MNYRHAFHAGNFADVVKHAVLVRMLVHLRQKPAAFRVIDTHAGPGLYDLGGPEALRSGEWRDGIGRLLAAPIGEHARALLKAGTVRRVAVVCPTTPLTRQWAHAAGRLGLHLVRRCAVALLPEWSVLRRPG